MPAGVSSAARQPSNAFIGRPAGALRLPQRLAERFHERVLGAVQVAVAEPATGGAAHALRAADRWTPARAPRDAAPYVKTDSRRPPSAGFKSQRRVRIAHDGLDIRDARR